MKKFIVIGLILVIGLSVLGCTPTMKSEPLSISAGFATPTVTLPPVTVTQPPVIIKVTPTPTPKPKTIMDNTYIYPTSIDQRYKAGTLISEWSYNDPTPIVGHKAGEPLSIVIHNGESEQTVFNVSVVIPDLPSNYSERLKKFYPSAPKDILDWVKLGSNKVILAPDSMAKIPFTIDIPSGAQLSGEMEFRILVVNSKLINSGNGMMTQTAGEVRVFMN